MRRIVERGNIVHSEYIRAVFEGIARGQSQLNEPRAFQTLEEGRRYSNITDESNETVLLNVQYLRSKAELINRLEPTEKDLLQTISIEGLRLAQAYKFNKYVDIFTAMLNEATAASSLGHLQATPRSN